MSDDMKALQAPNGRKRKWPRRLGITLASIVAAIAIGAIIVSHNAQIVVGAFQGYQSQNSFTPHSEPTTSIRDNGIVYANDIRYGDDYPNSYLDISYPDGGLSGDLPTVVFFHGGGFFGGDKVFGDPLATDGPANLLNDRIIEQGVNFVNVNYALVPEYRFPTPVIQMNQALGYLREHAEEYNLNMDNVFIMGSSAGAIMTAEYGAILSNPDYSEAIGISPSIPLESVRGLIIDDAPLIYDHFGLATKFLIGNYIDGTLFPDDVEKSVYNPIGAVTEDFPATLLIGSSYTDAGYAYDMEQLSDALESHGVRHDFFYETRTDGSEADHGLLNTLPTGDPIAVDAFDHLTTFISSKSF